VHGFGVEDETAATLGVDVFIAGCHKWIFGPRGTGLVWANAAGWAASSPSIPSFDGMWRPNPGSMPAAGLMTPGGFHSFEHRWALEAAFRFHQAIGKARVARRIRELNEQCRRGLAEMRHVQLHTPLSPDAAAGIICFEVAGMKPDEVVERLKQRKVIASVTPRPYGVDYARLSPSLLTSPEEVDAALRAVRELA
jgi:selenocysteine lyase/cysteine desulfurase